jgi:hypothetical protein
MSTTSFRPDRIETGERLVEDQQPRLDGQGVCQRRALQHALGKAAQAAVGNRREIETFQPVQAVLAFVAETKPVQAQAHQQDFIGR